MEKKIRFSDLVRNSGRPEVTTLWTDPKRDKTNQMAIKQNRVVTVVQEPTSKKKDYGRIGFHEQPHASYLIFPRSLPHQPDARVIGINYQLIQEAEVSNRVNPEPQRKRFRTGKPKPAQKQFNVTVRRTAIMDTELSVTANNRDEAERRVIQLVKERSFSVAQAKMNEEIVRTK